MKGGFKAPMMKGKAQPIDVFGGKGGKGKDGGGKGKDGSFGGNYGGKGAVIGGKTAPPAQVAASSFKAGPGKGAPAQGSFKGANAGKGGKAPTPSAPQAAGKAQGLLGTPVRVAGHKGGAAPAATSQPPTVRVVPARKPSASPGPSTPGRAVAAPSPGASINYPGGTLRVTSPKMSDDIVAKTVTGTYEPHGENHGRKTYKKLEKVDGMDDMNVFLYYWDDRDGPSFSGWWFGDEVGGSNVFVLNQQPTAQPPAIGWKVPWDADEIKAGGLLVSLIGNTAMKVAPASAGGSEPAKGKSKGKAAAAPAGPVRVKMEMGAPGPSPISASALSAWAQQVEGLVTGAQQSLQRAKAGSPDALSDLQAAGSKLRDAQSRLSDDVRKAKNAGASGEAALKELSALAVKMRNLQGGISTEVTKLTKAASAAAGQAAKAAEKETAAREIEEKHPAAEQAVATAEEMVETLGSLTSSVTADDTDESREVADEALKEIDRISGEATRSVAEAIRAINAVMALTRKAGDALPDAAGRMEEMTALKSKAEAANQKLLPLKRFKMDFQKRAGQLEQVRKLIEKCDYLDTEVEKLTMMVDDCLKKATSSEEEVKAVEALIAKIHPAVAMHIRGVEAKSRSADAEVVKAEMQMLQERTQECNQKLEHQIAEFKLVKEKASWAKIMEEAQESAQKVQDAVAACESTEAPFKTGAKKLADEEMEAAIKAAEGAASKVDVVVAQGKGWLRQKLTEFKAKKSEATKDFEEELEKLLGEVEKYSEKHAALLKSTFEQKYSSLSELFSHFGETEGKLKELADAVKTLEQNKDGGENLDTVKTIVDKAMDLEKQASASARELGKAIDGAKAKGGSLVAINQLQNRHTALGHELASLRKVVNTRFIGLKAQHGLKEQQERVKKISEDAEKASKLVEAEELDEKAVWQFEQLVAETLEAIQASEKGIADSQKQASLKVVAEETFKKMIEQVQAAKKSIAEVQSKTKEKRQAVLCKVYPKEVKRRLEELDAALEKASEAELPFLSGLEVLPSEQAADALEKCDAAEQEGNKVHTEARLFITQKIAEVKKYETEAGKACDAELMKLIETLNASWEKLKDFQRDFAEHRRKADLQKARDQLEAVEEAVKKATATAAKLNPTEEEAAAEDSAEAKTEADEKEETAKQKEAAALIEAARSEMEKAWELVTTREKKEGRKLNPDSAKVLQEIKVALTKADDSLAIGDMEVKQHEGRFMAKQLVAEALEQIAACAKEVDAAAAAAAPLVDDGGEIFLVDACLEVLTAALQKSMAKAGTGLKEEFKKASGGSAAISADAFVAYLAKLPQELSREDLDFQEERRRAMFSRVAGAGADSMTEDKFAGIFRQTYRVIQKISMTNDFSVSESKAVTKLAVGDLLLASGDAKVEESSGLLRLQGTLLEKEKEVTGWVTFTGNQGTTYLEAVSPYSKFLQETDKIITDARGVSLGLMKWMQQKIAELGQPGANESHKAAQAELRKVRQKGMEQQKRIDNLRTTFESSQKTYAQNEANERTAHIERKDRATVDALTAPVKQKAEELATALAALEEAMTPVSGLSVPEQKLFSTPLQLQSECIALASKVKKLADEVLAFYKEKMQDFPKTGLTVPFVDGKRAMMDWKAKAEAAVGRQMTLEKLAAQVCKLVTDAARSKLSAVLVAHRQKLGETVDEYFAKVAKGAEELAADVLTNHLATLEDASIPADHIKLLCAKGGQNGMSKRYFAPLAQTYYEVVKDITVTPTYEIASGQKPVRKLETGEFLELLEGPKTDDAGMTRAKGKALKDGLVGWVSVSGNKGSTFLKEIYKPYYATSKAMPLHKDEDGKEDPVRELRPEEILEVLEGPRRLGGRLSDFLTARVKSMKKDGPAGHITVRDETGTTIAEQSDKLYVCDVSTGISDDFDVTKCKILRKVGVGEMLIRTGEPKLDEDKGLTRAEFRAVKDGKEGWVAISGPSTTYLTASTKHWVLRKAAPLTKLVASDSEELAKLEEGDHVELVSGPSTVKVDVPMRVRGHVLGDSAVGWISLKDVKRCRPTYSCVRPTAMTSALEVSESATTVKEVERGELLDPLGAITETGVEEKLLRLRCRSERDGATGWVTLQDASGNFLAALGEGQSRATPSAPSKPGKPNKAITGLAAMGISTDAVTRIKDDAAVEEDEDKVEATLSEAREVLRAAKADTDRSNEEKEAEIEAMLETLKDLLAELMAEGGELKATSGKMAQVAANAKQAMRVRQLQAGFGIELKKLRAGPSTVKRKVPAPPKAPPPGAPARPAGVMRVVKVPQTRPAAGRDSNAEVGSSPEEAVVAAETAIESLGDLKQEYMTITELDCTVAEAQQRVDETVSEASRKISQASRTVNAALQQKKKAGAEEDVEALTALKARIDKLLQRFTALRKLKSDFESRAKKMNF
eukprot:TRINITY_DN112007_c0_g1_i1.p1 TRINITY_DN112007_c0_g1~~TRINITY_DN112007_c0_g1_i1.p1  ORF type:complete len:2409 (+),score=889.80 TRINITY_DN112007_c0_g1_i1:115-7341(+)